MTYWSFEEHLTQLKEMLSSLSSHQLEALRIRSHSSRQSLDSILAILSGLKDIDGLLAGPQFRRLRRVVLEYLLPIFEQEISDTSKTLLATAPSCKAVQLGSGLQPEFPDDLVAQLDVFRPYAHNLLQSKVNGELKQLCSRGILEFEPNVFAAKQVSDKNTNSRRDEHAESSATDTASSSTQTAGE